MTHSSARLERKDSLVAEEEWFRDTGFRFEDFIVPRAPPDTPGVETATANFCSRCGSSRIAGRTLNVDTPEQQQVCHHCSAVHYQNPKIVVRCIAERDGRLLLCRRAEEPRRGYWSTPGGFLANGEALQSAAIRETSEEAGAQIANLRLAFVHELPQLEEVVMIFRAQIVNERLAAGGESLEARLFEPSHIPWNEMAFPTDSVALQRHFHSHPVHDEVVHVAEFFWGNDGRILARGR